MHIHLLKYVDFNGGNCISWKVIFQVEFSVTTVTHTKYAIGRANDKTSPNGPLIAQKVTHPLYTTNIIDWYHWVPLGAIGEPHITTFNFCTSFFRLVSKINDNFDFKTFHLTPTRMAPLNSPYFTSHECIFLGCLEHYYRSRYTTFNFCTSFFQIS